MLIFAKLVFYFLMSAITLYALISVYALIRFAQSKALALIVSALFLIIMLSLFGAAVGNFRQIPFEQFSFFY